MKIKKTYRPEETCEHGYSESHRWRCGACRERDAAAPETPPRPPGLPKRSGFGCGTGVKERGV